MNFTIHTADTVGNAKNCLYPHETAVTDADSLANALAHDHTCSRFKGSYRSVGNFIESDVIVMDFDNDQSDDPKDWITPDKICDLMPDVSLAIAPSRNNMVAKNGKTARPKGHVYFPISIMADADEYAAIKRGIQKKYPFFDNNALDAARFIFGASMTAGDITWQDGWLTIDDEVEAVYEADDSDEPSSGIIREGNRNKTLSRFAGRILKRYGESDKAKREFLDEAAKCDPPLPNGELRTIWQSALRFFRRVVSAQDGYVSPDDYNNDFSKAGSLKPDDYSDIGEARVLTAEYGDALRYSEATDFLCFDGDRWCEDKQMAVGAAEEFLDYQLADAQDYLYKTRDELMDSGVSDEAIRAGGKTLEKAVQDSQREAFFNYLDAVTYLSFVKKRRDYKNIVAAMNAAKPMLALNIDDLDQDGFLLNTPYATYDLRKGLNGVRPHDPFDLITKMAAASPGDKGRDIWENALQLFFSGDRELIEYVQMNIGLAAIGQVFMEQMLIAYGEGANGKSTFFNSISNVLGDYSGKLSAETLTMGCKHNVKPEMAELKGKRLIIASEMDEGMRLNTAVVKQLCSTDEIFAEKKYKAPFKFTPSHTLVLYTNHLPRIGANDDGIWRRIVVIPFNAKITGTSDIKNYSNYLVENAGEAILTWIIEGAEKAIAADFRITPPGCVQDAINAYREVNDWFGHFLEECCDVDPAASERSGDLYTQYRSYALQNGEYVRSTTDFYSAVEKGGFFRHKTNRGYMIEGLKLKDGQDFL